MKVYTDGILDSFQRVSGELSVLDSLLVFLESPKSDPQDWIKMFLQNQHEELEKTIRYAEEHKVFGPTVDDLRQKVDRIDVVLSRLDSR